MLDTWKKNLQNPLHLTLKHFIQFTPIQTGIKTYLKNVLDATLKAKELKILINAASTAQKMKISIKDFCSKYDQIWSFLRIWSHLLKKYLIENFLFCAVQCLEAQLFTTFSNLPYHIVSVIILEMKFKVNAILRNEH